MVPHPLHLDASTESKSIRVGVWRSVQSGFKLELQAYFNNSANLMPLVFMPDSLSVVKTRCQSSIVSKITPHFRKDAIT